MTPDWLRYTNQNAIRNKPLSGGLIDALSFLPGMGVEMEVFSGGQSHKGSGGARTGSTRHDHGNAADAFFYKDGRKLDWNNPDDVPLFQSIVQQAKSNGVTGFGAGDGYMQQGSMHIGFGNEGVWGAGGKGANAAKWLSEATHGQPGHNHAAAVSGGASNNTVAGGLSMTPASQPDHLQGAQMQQPQQQDQRGHMFLKGMDPATRDRLILAMQGMTMNPNQGLMGMAQQNIQGRADEAKEVKVAQAKQQASNQTREWINQQVQAGKLPAVYAELAQNDPAGAYKQAVGELTKGPEKKTALQQNVEYIQENNPGMAFDQALQGARSGQTINVNGDKAPAADATLRNEMQKGQAKNLTAISKAGSNAAAVMPDLTALRELSQLAPSGPLTGRLAQAFPEFNDVSAVRQAIVKRVAPTLRAEGSGSTSDIEYAGMVDGLGRLTNTPEANTAIADVMIAKAQLDIQRSNLIMQYQNQQIPYEQFNQQMSELNQQSIMPDSLKALLSGANKPGGPMDFSTMSDAELQAIIDGDQ